MRTGASSSGFVFRDFLAGAFLSISPFSSDVLSSEELAISQRCNSEAVGRLGPYSSLSLERIRINISPKDILQESKNTH